MRNQSGLMTILFIFLFSLLVNALRFFEITTEQRGEVIQLTPTALRSSWVYVLTRHMASLTFDTIVPLLSLFYMNLKICISVKQRNRFLPRLNMNQVREIAVTKVLITIVMFYILCHSLKHFFIVFELTTFLTSKDTSNYKAINNRNVFLDTRIESKEWNQIIVVLKCVSNVLVCVQCSAGFAIFTHKDTR